MIVDIHPVIFWLIMGCAILFPVVSGYIVWLYVSLPKMIQEDKSKAIDFIRKEIFTALRTRQNRWL